MIACQGFQNSDLRDKNGGKIYLFNDGALQSLKGSDKLQSRFKIDFLESSFVSIRNILGEHLDPQTMEWTSEHIAERFFNLEQNEDFVSFKSNDEAYLTFTEVNKLTFKKSSEPEENQKFLLDEQCSPSNPFSLCFLVNKTKY